MASVSVSRGLNTLTSVRYYKMVGLIVLGAFVSTVASGWVQNNVIDLGIPFSDAVYSLITVLLIRMLMGGRASLLVAAGAGTGMAISVFDEMGL